MNFTLEHVASWQAGASGFLQWLKDVRPRVLGQRGSFEVFEIEGFQEQAVRKLLARKRNGDYKYGTLVLTWPRRHSKSTLCALLVLWRMTTRPNENIVILSNSEKQSATVGYGLCKKIALATAALRDQIGTTNIQAFRMEVPKLGSSLRTVAGNPSALYGEKLSCAWVSEIHASQSDEAMQILASSLGDTANSWLICDSTTDGVGGILHRLEQLAESGEDRTIGVSRIEYRDLDEALQKSPRWIRKEWLRSRQKQLLPQVFASQHLNLRQESTSSLFRKADIAACQDRLPHPMTLADVEAVAAGRSFVCGGGLDRAYFASAHGDRTIWTSVVKIASPDPVEEPHYYVLNQKEVFASLGVGIRKAMQTDFDAYRLQNAVIEAYNAQDVATWAMDKGYAVEIVHATAQAQVPAFMALHRIVAEGRLHFSDKLELLAQEMETFTYALVNGQPRFGSDKWHDDTIYSLAWAIHSLRQQELASYSLDSIVCASRSAHAQACYLRGGDLILPCGQACRTHIQVQAMHNQYRAANVESEITIPEFFTALVDVDGIAMHF